MKTVHVFCRVVDHFGDAGVCWRLARELVAEHGLSATLFIDDLATLARIESAVDVRTARQIVAGVGIEGLDDDARPRSLPDLVVEGFGCGLPVPYVDAMAIAPAKPRWINLEYLSAEAWVDGAHGLASLHPQLPLVRHFWFPGLTPRTGGLLRERGLFAQRDACRAPHAATDDALRILLFTYENRALPALFTHWMHAGERIECFVPEGVAVASLERWLGTRLPSPGDRVVRGTIVLSVLPFTNQDGFDRHLWNADVNFVRGEDSFVRAQWAARPFVWQAYRQAEAAHLTKIDAFVARYVAGLDADPRRAVATFWQAFNAEDEDAIGRAWLAFRSALPRLAPHAHAWADRLAGAVPELAASLVEFARSPL